jgi:peptidoglycan hydrolase-like protein with peptidoglycan-binding domain
MAPIDQGAGLAPQQLSQNEGFVRQVQQKLNAAGYDVGTVDGRWGPRSQQALTNYQRDNGLQPTGALSTEVASALNIPAPNEPQAAQMPGDAQR